MPTPPDAPSTEATVPLAVPPGEGRHLWHLDNLMTFKALARDTGGRLAVWEQLLPHRSSPPLHVHHGEDEAWFVLDGTLTFQVEDRTWTADAGTFVWAPRELPHTFRVDSPTARLLGLTVPGGFEEFFLATGRPAEAPTVPPPPEGPPDIAGLSAVAGRYGCDIVGPPLLGGDPMPPGAPDGRPGTVEG
jgi:quercetin dioxygenase-like cupin family protein